MTSFSALLDNSHPSWQQAILEYRAQLAPLLSVFSAKNTVPPAQLAFRAFEQDAKQIKVVILGQDPYPTVGHANGLAFSVNCGIKPLPRSLQNIYSELESDLGIVRSNCGNLTAWESQGVLLLNSSLSTEIGNAGSHAKLGWDGFVRHLLSTVISPQEPVAILWGKHAQSFSPFFNSDRVIASAHPSPLSARKGFFGSKPFSGTNKLLIKLSKASVDWQIPPCLECDKASAPSRPTLF